MVKIKWAFYPLLPKTPKEAKLQRLEFVRWIDAKLAAASKRENHQGRSPEPILSAAQDKQGE